jgi:hypothetical protein
VRKKIWASTYAWYGVIFKAHNWSFASQNSASKKIKVKYLNFSGGDLATPLVWKRLAAVVKIQHNIMYAPTPLGK